MIQTEEIVLAGCLTDRVGLIKEKVRAEFFQKSIYQKIFKKLIDFYVEYQIPMSQEALKAAFEKENSEENFDVDLLISQISAPFDEALILQKVTDIKEEYQLREIKKIGEDIINSQEKEFDQLAQQAKTKILSIETLTHNEVLLEELTSSESIEAHLKIVDDFHNPEKNVAFYTGLAKLDKITTGGKPQRLWTVIGQPGHGKSRMLLNFAYYMAIEQKKNVVYCDAEMGITKARTIFHTIYATKKHKLLEVDTRDIESGNLTKQQIIDTAEAARSIAKGVEEGRYGKVFFIPAAGLSLVDAHLRCEEINKQDTLDAILVDYASKLAPITPKRNDPNEEVNETYRYAERMKLKFANGRGIFVVTAHQLTKEGIKSAIKTNGVYQLVDLYRSSEAANASDCIISLFRRDKLRDADQKGFTEKEIIVGVLKNRDGKTFQDEEFIIRADWKSGSLLNLEESIRSGMTDLSKDMDLDADRKALEFED